MPLVIFCTLADKGGGNSGHNVEGNVGPVQIQKQCNSY